jgi:hypothetical protein
MIDETNRDMFPLLQTRGESLENRRRTPVIVLFNTRDFVVRLWLDYVVHAG